MYVRVHVLGRGVGVAGKFILKVAAHKVSTPLLSLAFKTLPAIQIYVILRIEGAALRFGTCP